MSVDGKHIFRIGKSPHYSPSGRLLHSDYWLQCIACPARHDLVCDSLAGDVLNRSDGDPTKSIQILEAATCFGRTSPTPIVQCECNPPSVFGATNTCGLHPNGN